MKRKNAGFTTVEIVIAAVILVAVVVGLLLVVKLSKKSDAPSKDEEQATQIVDSLLNQVDACVKSADLDVNYDADKYVRFVGRNKYQIFWFDSASSQVYLLEKESAGLGNDDEIRQKVSEMKPAKEEMTSIASNIKVFVIDLIDFDTEKGLVRTSVRAQVGSNIEGNVSKTKDTPLHTDAIKYFVERSGKTIDLPSVTPTPTPAPTSTPTTAPTPTEAQQPGDSTPTPEPTKPADTPTPEPTEAPKELVTVTKTDNTIVVNTLVTIPDDATFTVRIRRNSEEAGGKGQTVGGIGFDVYVPATGYEFVLDRDYENEEEETFTFNLGEIRKIANQGGIKKLCIKVDTNLGFSFVDVEMEYYK